MVKMAKNYYEVLGVSKTATADQIKNAFRELALKFHPDKNKDKNAEEKFKEINEAYAVLGDPQKRSEYDAVGPAGFGKKYTEEDIFRNFNFEDVIRDMQQNLFGFDTGMGGNFGDMFGAQQQEQTGVNLYLSFDEIERGVDKEFEVQRVKTCEHCKGSGGEPGTKQIKCPTCNGTGRTHIQQNTPFGRFDAIIPCQTCGGRGKTFEKKCTVCKGQGRVVVKERFKVKAESSNKEGKEKPKGKFWIF
jgi:molecular chaperone DnaJ